MKAPDIHTHATYLTPDRWAIRNLYPSALPDALSNPQFPAYSCGLHPWFLSTSVVDKNLEMLELYASSPQLLAIGEAGLDRAISTDFEWQTRLFLQQIAIAEAVQKPMILHCVRAYSDIIGLRKKLRPSMPWVLHGFQGNLQIARDCWRNGCYLSFGAALLRPNSKLRATFAACPAEVVFLETDEETIGFGNLVDLAAQIRFLDTDVWIGQLWQNVRTVFGYES